MSVFRQQRYRNYVPSTEVPPLDERKCRGGHRWNGIIPTVQEKKFEVQNPHLIGTRCDCGAMLYVSEGECGCPTNKYWQIYFDN